METAVAWPLSFPYLRVMHAHALSTRARRLRARVRAALIAAFIATTAVSIAAKELIADTGAVFDMPSGFTAGDGDGKTRFAYFDANDGMEFDIRIYEPGRYATAEAMAEDILGQIGARGDTSSFTYQGRRAVISSIDFAMGGSAHKGYAVFIAGTATTSLAAARESGYALIASSEASRFDAYSELIISCLDSFSIDRAARRFPGPVSQFLLPWPVARNERKAVALPSGTVSLPWSTEEEKHARSVAEREYRIMALYLQSETLWQDAWARYYRMVYKESAARLDSFTEAFAASLPVYDPTESARRVLAWVQGFLYERDFAGTDFVPPLTAGFEKRGDCDARAMVMAIILEGRGIDSVLMVSREYSHAMLAVDVPGGGQRFTFGGKAYLVAETTATVGIGMMDASQTDVSKWMGVDVGY
jgi:hypothetical protein